MLAFAPVRECRPDQRSPIFRVNGTHNPNIPKYAGLAASRFTDWRLDVGGLVQRPLRPNLAPLRAMPQRVQITRHDCAEGWSAMIGAWQGPQLGTILPAVGISPLARFAVFHGVDRYGATHYCESIDLVDAFHPGPACLGPERCPTG